MYRERERETYIDMCIYIYIYIYIYICIIGDLPAVVVDVQAPEPQARACVHGHERDGQPWLRADGEEPRCAGKVAARCRKRHRREHKSQHLPSLSGFLLRGAGGAGVLVLPLTSGAAGPCPC